MQPIYLLCGVPGSGKTWVATQLNQFSYVPHDKYPVADYHKHLLASARHSNKPVLGEAPFRISVLVDHLKDQGAEVKTYYISEPEIVVKSRYEARDKKDIPKQHLTNLKRYNEREWDVKGNAHSILSALRNI